MVKIKAIGKLVGNFVIFLYSQGISNNRMVKRLK